MAPDSITAILVIEIFEQPAQQFCDGDFFGGNGHAPIIGQPLGNTLVTELLCLEVIESA
ncbi:MAG TPA: hypothetical protein PLI09_14460 [Candidatus Hydrogenedentes bacterium]|nr:hypothetical protein [Candidatus Hydrogenedentota bacterium]